MDNITKLKKYRQFKSDIVNIDIKLQELEDDMLGVSAQPQGERTSQTYKITSQVEVQAEQHIKNKDRLLKKKGKLVRNIARIENAIESLREEEKDIIQMAIVEQKKYALIEIKYNLTYARIKQIERQALKDMDKYLADIEM